METEQNSPPDGQSQPAIRVLLVEDSAVNQIVILHHLRDFGYRADLAKDGLEALQAVEKASYHVILMDCEMPKMDGYTAAAQIRKQEGNSRHTPILAMTSHSNDASLRKCLESGMDDYLYKPAHPDQLRKLLEKWLARSQAR